MPDEVGRVIQALELGHQPGGVLVLRRAEPFRAHTVEPGPRQGHAGQITWFWWWVSCQGLADQW
jgi:hypothetical protein